MLGVTLVVPAGGGGGGGRRALVVAWVVSVSLQGSNACCFSFFLSFFLSFFTINIICFSVPIELQHVLLKANFRYCSSHIHVCFLRRLKC